MNPDEFEPWRKRMAKAFADKPNLEVTKFSKELGKNRDYVRRLIKDGTAHPSPTLFIEICDKLEVSPAYIISGDEPSDMKDKVARRVLEADTETLRRVVGMLDLLAQDSSTQ